MELLSFVAMEPPVSFEASAVRAEKVKVWRAILPIHPTDTARGQYGPGTIDGKPSSAIARRSRQSPIPDRNLRRPPRRNRKLRWAGVPFYIRAGKRLAKRVTEITIQFKQPRCCSQRPRRQGGEGIKPNVISMRIQPDEGIALRFGAKVPAPA